jgi:hypothetical protein
MVSPWVERQRKANRLFRGLAHVAVPLPFFPWEGWGEGQPASSAGRYAAPHPAWADLSTGRGEQAPIRGLKDSGA